MTNGPANIDQVHAVLKKVLASGALLRVPKNPHHQLLVMALISLNLQRRYPYNEVELKDVLTRALAMFPAEVDHVTCRRYLVDLGFMKRDRAGTRYYLNFPKLEAALDAEISPENLSHLIANARGSRRG